MKGITHKFDHWSNSEELNEGIHKVEGKITAIVSATFLRQSRRKLAETRALLSKKHYKLGEGAHNKLGEGEKD